MEFVPARTPVDALASALGAEWPMILKARSAALESKAQLSAAVRDLVSQEDMSVVVFGSLARNEVTSGSDTDWTLLLDGQASPTHFDVALKVEAAVRSVSGKGPGREGTFGGFAVSHDILHKIGGGEDTNRNLTQRILLLLESEALGPGQAHERVLRGVLTRYITEDAGWAAKSVTLPRFLLNDIARYWRTVAVDFAYKRRERAAEGWALRTVKLRLSRKLTYASGLLACFTCAMEQAVIEAQDRSKAVIDHLLGMIELTPLERVAQILLNLGLLNAAERLFRSYDGFLELLDNRDARESLEVLSPDDAGRNDDFGKARALGHEFQGALDEIFFLDNHTAIPRLTRQYGVF